MSTSTQSSEKSLSMILKEQPYLYDLHTHLLGMGNAGFWIDTILMDKYIMPTNQTFKGDEATRVALCPLVWDNDNTGFVDGKKTAEFFKSLVDNNIFRKENGEVTGTMGFEEAIKPLEVEFPVLHKLIDMNIYQDLIHGGLEFKHDFSYDVVLKLSDLGKSLGIKDSNCEGFVQLAVTEKLGGHLPGRLMNFRHFIIFNARKQKFEIVYGIQVEQLRELIRVDPNNPNEAAKLARGHIINAFSMCNAEGTSARPIDLHSFHGFFTPEFYPRRFVLKDSIYHQRLDVLAALIAHIIERYQRSLPPVTYCEFSVSVNDLTKQCVFDVLRSVRIYDDEEINRSKKDPKPTIYKADANLSSFSQIVLNGHFPHLQVAFKGPTRTNDENVIYRMPHVTYKFLAGFDRRKIKSPFPENQDEALNSLYFAPHEAILLMMKEIKKSRSQKKNNSKTSGNEQSAACIQTEKDEGKAFELHLKQLKDLEEIGNNENLPWFYKWVVGLDLFGDELGYPYCSFVARQFIEFVESRRNEKNPEKKNIYFGVRIHCGENVKYASDDNPAYRIFIGHMYIVFRCLLFLQEELRYGIRIGHGIAYNHILNANLSSSRYRKSSVLMAEMQDHANYLFKKIAFEVNITSNEYLLGQSIRQGDYAQILRIKPLFDMKAPIVLSTDDDGIWPIDQCSSVHPGHHSLAAEYCRAISNSLIDSDEDLKWTFETMKQYCFWDMENEMQASMVKHANSNDNPRMNTVIVHPDIIRLIDKQYVIRSVVAENPAFENYRTHSKPQSDRSCEVNQSDLSWTNQYGAMRVAFICICANQEGYDKEKLREEYRKLFDTPENAMKEFDFIYDSWQNILSDFVVCKTGTPPQITLDHQKRHVFYSMQSSSEDLLTFLENICWSGKEINIRAYAKEGNIEQTVNNFETWSNDRNNGNPDQGTLLLFTNTNKYTYAYSKLDEKFKLQLNPQPSKRELTDENFLYVLCSHASAATAALNLICEQLSKFAKDPSTLSFTINNPTLFGSANVPCSPPANDKPVTENAVGNTPDCIPKSFILHYENDQSTLNSNVRGDHGLKQTHPNDNDDGNKPKRQNTTENETSIPLSS